MDMIQLQQRRDLQKLLDHIDHWPAAEEKDSELQRARRLAGNTRMPAGVQRHRKTPDPVLKRIRGFCVRPGGRDLFDSGQGDALNELPLENGIDDNQRDRGQHGAGHDAGIVRNILPLQVAEAGGKGHLGL